MTNCRNLTITDCTFETPGAPNVYTRGILTDHVVIENCHMIGGTWRGEPVIQGTGQHIIRHCTINPVSDTAIELLLANNSTLTDNQIKGQIHMRPTPSAP